MHHARVLGLIFVFATTCSQVATPTPTVTRLVSPAHPEGGVQSWVAEELWRTGGNDEEVIFGAISGVTADAAGRIYLLDGQLAAVHVFAPTGELLRTISRQGDGPGESRNPTDLCLLRPGVLGLAQPYPGRVITVDCDGVPAGDLHYSRNDEASSPFAILQLVRATDDLLVLGGLSINYGDKGGYSQQLFLARCTPEGRELGRYLERHSTIDHSDFELNELDTEMPWDRVALATAGRLYCAPDRNQFVIQIFAADGRLQMEMAREYESLPRSPEQLVGARRNLEAYSRYYPQSPRSIQICPTEPDITGLWPRADGELWVRTSRGDRHAAAGADLVLDVFDAAGRFSRQVALHSPCDPAHDLLYPLGQDRLLVVRGGRDASLDLKGSSRPGGGDESVAVICCRLEEVAP